MGIIFLAGNSSRAELEVSAAVQIHATADFQAPLASHGVWVEVGSHGRCWRPAHVPGGWRPYCTGSWVWTDSGWYWASDEPWAWACYHYGRWVYDGHAGWVWVPGVEWAPAWVSWRVGPSHVGWAPLPPGGKITVGVAAPGLFVFVGAGHFTQPIRPSVLIVNKPGLFKETKALTHISREERNFGGAGPQKVVVNHGPSVKMIEQASGKSLKPVSIREAAGRTRVPPEVARKHPAPEKQTPKAAAKAEPSRGQESKALGPASEASHGGGPNRGIAPSRGGGGWGGSFGGGGRGGGGGGKGRR